MTLFVVVWVGALLVALVLDWLGNRSRGRFWPVADRTRGIRGRWELRRRRRRDREAMVRRTLQATYGRETLRWSARRRARTGAPVVTRRVATPPSSPDRSADQPTTAPAPVTARRRDDGEDDLRLADAS